MKKVVVLSGAGISAESGLKTFRGSDGLWENHNVYDVATPEAWAKNPALVQKFYNQRRQQCRAAQPNAGHLALVDLEKDFDVHIITQNIDDLHERAGSTNILHLHGEITKARSSTNETLVYDLKDGDIQMGDTCAEGSQLRPHIVWFGELVPNISIAQKIIRNADFLIIVGTSLNVYPAAGLVHFAPNYCNTIFVDPNDCPTTNLKQLSIIKEIAGTGLSKAAKLIRSIA